MATEDDITVLVGDFKGATAFGPMVNVPNVDLSGVSVDQMLDVFETKIARWRR